MGVTCKILRRLRRNGGFSMIEIMIVGGLIAFIAIALMPAIFSVVDSSKNSGFRAQCSGAVRAKIQEYINGVADNATGGSGFIPTGFEYTKVRYQTFGYASCGTINGSANISGLGVTSGFREAIYGNGVLGNVRETDISGANGKSAVMQGFQLWVNIHRYNPRQLVDTSGAVTTNLTGVPWRDCPPQYDQFYRLGDAFEVTVKGLVRTDTAVSAGGRGCAPVGKLYDKGHTSCSGSTGNGTEANEQLTCSATEIIYPPRLPFRYYLSGDGKIRNYQASIAMTSGTTVQTSRAAIESHFRNIWVTGGNAVTSLDTAPVIANIRAFAVAPDNSWVYVLRPGEVSLYGPCTDQDVSVTDPALGSLTFKSTPDCPTAPAGRWMVDGNIETLAVDFGKTLGTANSATTDDMVYALLTATSENTGGTGSGNGSSSLIRLPLSAIPGSPTTAIHPVETTAFSLPLNRPRIRGMFIAQTFPTGANSMPNLFFFDNTCYAAASAGASGVLTSTFCAAIFNAGDTKDEQVIREMPLQVEGVSY